MFLLKDVVLQHEVSNSDGLENASFASVKILIAQFPVFFKRN